MRRKPKKKEIDDTIPYEYRDLTSLPIPLDQQRGMWTKPEIILVGGKDTNDAVQPLKIDTTGRLDVVGICPEFQAMNDWAQASPVSGTKYEVMAETELVRLMYIATRCTWTVQPTPLEVHLTVDGQSLTGYKNNPVSNTWYYFRFSPYTTMTTLPLTTGTPDVPYVLDARTLKIEQEVTGGTVSNTQARVWYALW